MLKLNKKLNKNINKPNSQTSALSISIILKSLVNDLDIHCKYVEDIPALKLSQDTEDTLVSLKKEALSPYLCNIAMGIPKNNVLENAPYHYFLDDLYSYVGEK